MRELSVTLAVILALAGCRAFGVKDETNPELERTFAESDRQVRETRTLSSLVEMETALSSYIKHERRIPTRIDQLIPKYLAEVPTTDLAIKYHRDTNRVKYYSADILRDGQIDGTKLKDTGAWGYVFNERQVVLFVDCTHPSSRGKPWYQERGSQ